VLVEVWDPQQVYAFVFWTRLRLEVRKSIFVHHHKVFAKLRHLPNGLAKLTRRVERKTIFVYLDFVLVNEQELELEVRARLHIDSSWVEGPHYIVLLSGQQNAAAGHGELSEPAFKKRVT
jgi:hypothetical protein